MVVKNVRKKKDIVEDEMAEAKIIVPTEGQPESQPVPVKIETAPSLKKETERKVYHFYCLLINDEVQRLGAKGTSPQGDWYYTLLDLSEGKMYGAFPLLVENGGKLHTVRGFVQLPALADLVYSDVRRLGLKGLSTEPHTPLDDLRNCKMMSVPIEIEF